VTRHLKHTLWTLLLTVTLFTSPALAAGKGVVLNFNEVDISTMVKFISDLTGRNFVLDDRVKGKISVYSPSKLSNEEAYNVFVSVLELKGFTVVQSGKVGKIVPSSSARQSGFTVLAPGVPAPVNENYVAQVNKLENISAQEALAFLQPMISKDGHISAFGPGNLILMVDSSLNIRKLQGILQTIDSERTREGLEIIYLKNASAETTAATVRQWLSGSDAKPTGQPATAGGSVIADVRLNALLVFGSETVKSAVGEMGGKAGCGAARGQQQGQRLLPGEHRCHRAGQGAGRGGQGPVHDRPGPAQPGIGPGQRQDQHHPRQGLQFPGHHGLGRRLQQPDPGDQEA